MEVQLLHSALWAAGFDVHSVSVGEDRARVVLMIGGRPATFDASIRRPKRARSKPEVVLVPTLLSRKVEQAVQRAIAGAISGQLAGGQ